MIFWATTVGILVLTLGALVAVYWHWDIVPASDDPARGDAVFLFGGDDLIDATPQAQSLISPYSALRDRDAVYFALAPHFPDLATAMANTSATTQTLSHTNDPRINAVIDWPNGQLRVAVQTSDDTQLKRAELAFLRQITKDTPQLVWRTGRNGQIIWANHAYHMFWDTVNPRSIVPAADQVLFAGLDGATGMQRIALNLPDSAAQHWFDLTSLRDDCGTLHIAADANAAVGAEQDRRNLVQTLGKTFAELSTGLAVFDKRRELTMFNPALLDMTRLNVEFLIKRPSVDTVLDRLREGRILPEPKNYATWRDQFTAVENGAKAGTYREIWNQHDGQVFRVTGRPHPDGAFALLFEDITADLSLTRRFRSDIETGQAVLDALPDAIAVFSAAGTLVMYNTAYGQSWGGRADQGLEHRELRSEMAQWQTQAPACDIWDHLAQMMQTTSPRQPWADDLTLHDGQKIRCHAHPISGGMTMLRFASVARGRLDLPPRGRQAAAIRAAKG